MNLKEALQLLKAEAEKSGTAFFVSPYLSKDMQKINLNGRLVDMHGIRVLKGAAIRFDGGPPTLSMEVYALGGKPDIIGGPHAD